MKTEPLFLAYQDGGKQFSADRQPLTARGITYLIKTVTRNAGLAEGTAYCFRRGAANDVCRFFSRPSFFFISYRDDLSQYEVILGKEFSEQLLTHTPGGSLHFYSENTANVNIVGARLNELPIPMDANKEVTPSNATSSCPHICVPLGYFEQQNSNRSRSPGCYLSPPNQEIE